MAVTAEGRAFREAQEAELAARRKSPDEWLQHRKAEQREGVELGVGCMVASRFGDDDSHDPYRGLVADEGGVDTNGEAWVTVAVERWCNVGNKAGPQPDGVLKRVKVADLDEARTEPARVDFMIRTAAFLCGTLWIRLHTGSYAGDDDYAVLVAVGTLLAAAKALRESGRG